MDAVAFLIVFLGIMTIKFEISRADRRAARLERKLDLVLEHLDLHEEVPRRDEIVALVREGKRIQAVKAYREVTGAGLAEAKEAVDRLG
ncbi:ribosomal protein L7/L12 [Streptomyces sp. NPDC001812]|uniref:ribosomal protein L7/L12 n=1 Tax=Streptomyces sp. NPDC001812 TaxID=3364611 RepID=UPI0036B84CCA